MAFRPDYVAKETANNLARNPTLTIATVLTVAVSLALLGSSLLIRKGVEDFNARFKDDVEFIVWMNPEASVENVETIRNFLDTAPQLSGRTTSTRKRPLSNSRSTTPSSPKYSIWSNRHSCRRHFAWSP